MNKTPGGGGTPMHRTTEGPRLGAQDLWIACLLLGVCGVLYYVTTTFDDVPEFLGQTMSPERFPRLLLGVIVGLALLLPFESRWHPNRVRTIDRARLPPIASRTWRTIGTLALVVLLAPAAGTTLTLCAICVTLPPLWGERRWALVATFAVAVTATVVYLFNVALQVYFEPGVLEVLMWTPG